MCRILVWTVDQNIPVGMTGDDLWKRGDIVEIVEDGAELGKAFDGHPSFRIVEFPGVPALKYKGKNAAEEQTVDIVDGNSVKIGTTIKMVRKCAYSIDVTSLEQLAATAKGSALAPGDKITGVVDTAMTLTAKVPIAQLPPIVSGGVVTVG